MRRHRRDPAVVEVSGGTVSLRVGPVPDPDLVLAGRPQLSAALFCPALRPVYRGRPQRHQT